MLWDEVMLMLYFVLHGDILLNTVESTIFGNTSRSAAVISYEKLHLKTVTVSKTYLFIWRMQTGCPSFVVTL